jgi:hypothetical protein
MSPESFLGRPLQKKVEVVVLLSEMPNYGLGGVCVDVDVDGVAIRPAESSPSGFVGEEGEECEECEE